MIKNQEWFDHMYSQEKGTKDIIRVPYGGVFEHSLAIENYPKLESLYLKSFSSIDKVELRDLVQLQVCIIWDCGMKELVIENCPQIKILNVSNNSLTGLNFLNSLTNSKELDLDISCNNFNRSDLTLFGSIVNLNDLKIGNTLIKNIVLWNMYNRFFGTLSPLRTARRLKKLDISNTNVSEGLDELPGSLTELCCSNSLIVSWWTRENECSQIVRELESYLISGNCYNLTLWRHGQHFYRGNNGSIHQDGDGQGQPASTSQLNFGESSLRGTNNYNQSANITQGINVSINVGNFSMEGYGKSKY